MAPDGYGVIPTISMPRDVAADPLRRPDIQQLLQGMLSDTHATAAVAVEAFAATAAGLYSWCGNDDVEGALAVVSVMPIPRPSVTTIHAPN